MHLFIVADTYGRFRDCVREMFPSLHMPWTANTLQHITWLSRRESIGWDKTCICDRASLFYYYDQPGEELDALLRARGFTQIRLGS